VFDHQKEYFNVPVQTLTPSQIRDSLVNLATDLLEAKGKVSGPKSKVFGELRDALEAKERTENGEKKIHGGNAAEVAMKYTRKAGPRWLRRTADLAVKLGRQNGIHVTPTVLFDGLKEDLVSSSWGKEEWEKFLEWVDLLAGLDVSD